MHPIDRSYERLDRAGKLGIRYDARGNRILFSERGHKEVLMADQTPTVGRALHYTEQVGQCLAATVAAVNADGTVNLGYLSEYGGNRQVQNVEIGDEAGQAHWPERV